MTQQRIHIVDSNVLIMGLSFKENCPDIRNTRVIDIINSLQEFNVNVDVHDPWADDDEAQLEYGIKLKSELNTDSYDAVILAVSHDSFKKLGAETIRGYGKSNCILFDVKYSLPKQDDIYRL
jgi:UDP-N-acetyl-D-glucosamine/UDP-N-acetyl-D-galactosamine dehydrogenase